MKTTKRTAFTLALAAVTALGISACTSSPTAQPTVTTAVSAEPTPAPVATDEVTEEVPQVASDPVPTTCPEFEMTAAHMATYWQYLTIALGTSNDEGPTLADLSSGAAAMQDLAPTCAPKAADSIDAFAAAVEAIQPVYETQPTGADVQTVNDALAAMQEAGAQMFIDLGRSDYSWQ